MLIPKLGTRAQPDEGLKMWDIPCLGRKLLMSQVPEPFSAGV